MLIIGVAPNNNKSMGFSFSVVYISFYFRNCLSHYNSSIFFFILFISCVLELQEVTDVILYFKLWIKERNISLSCSNSKNESFGSWTTTKKMCLFRQKKKKLFGFGPRLTGNADMAKMYFLFEAIWLTVDIKVSIFSGVKDQGKVLKISFFRIEIEYNGLFVTRTIICYCK